MGGGALLQVVETDDVAQMHQQLLLLKQLGHAKQCVGVYSAHMSQVVALVSGSQSATTLCRAAPLPCPEILTAETDTVSWAGRCQLGGVLSVERGLVGHVLAGVREDGL
jgi:hypothetical protein